MPPTACAGPRCSSAAATLGVGVVGALAVGLLILAVVGLARARQALRPSRAAVAAAGCAAALGVLFVAGVRSYGPIIEAGDVGARQHLCAGWYRAISSHDTATSRCHAAAVHAVGPAVIAAMVAGAVTGILAGLVVALLVRRNARRLDALHEAG